MIELKNISKEYILSKENRVTALKEINLTVEEGEFVAIVGKSGSRKINIIKYNFMPRQKNKRLIYIRWKQNREKEKQRTSSN